MSLKVIDGQLEKVKKQKGCRKKVEMNQNNGYFDQFKLQFLGDITSTNLDLALGWFNRDIKTKFSHFFANSVAALNIFYTHVQSVCFIQSFNNPSNHIFRLRGIRYCLRPTLEGR